MRKIKKGKIKEEIGTGLIVIFRYQTIDFCEWGKPSTPIYQVDFGSDIPSSTTTAEKFTNIMKKFSRRQIRFYDGMRGETYPATFNFFEGSYGKLTVYYKADGESIEKTFNMVYLEAYTK